MRIKASLISCFCFLSLLSLPVKGNAHGFFETQSQMFPYCSRENVLLVASPGRSGSTMLGTAMDEYASKKYEVFRTHLLPPKSNFQGKIVFIFSALSVLYLSIRDENFGFAHFFNVETSDRLWLREIRNTKRQTFTNNLLTYDALRIGKYLQEWLEVRTKPCTPSDAQILAVKYENLWDTETIQEIKNFLGIDSFELPTKKQRGYKEYYLFSREREARNHYNLGTKEQPRYAAYDEAREIWEHAPPFQYLKIIN
jgi:hypothetical protein